ncbi:MAG: hypothetical protein H6741_13125 [Alphaproteobacteria bacterium]|nr:hypothetical protein [Alphaproteobacteria bacterium]
MHEIVETVDKLLGGAPCSPHGGCGGTESCPVGCDAFVGLSCPGAPDASWTGCGGGQVQGWVVQRLASAGRENRSCSTCMTCDFTPRACAPGEAGCP